MAETTRISIAKLDNDNYQLWKYKVELLLIKEDLWDVVSESPPEEITPVWTKRDNRARATICLLVEDSQLQHVREATTAKQAWNALKAYHEKSTLSSKVFLLKSIVNRKLDEDGDMEEHINGTLLLVDKLAALGEKLVESLQIAILLGSLPDSYGTLVTALESRPDNQLTLTLVKGKLIDEYKRRKINKIGEVDKESALKVSSSSVTCYFCRKSGHIKRNCPRFKRWKNNKESAGNVVDVESEDAEGSVHMCFMIGASKPKETDTEWTIDSGASKHMSANRDVFTKFSAVKGSVMLADGRMTRTEGIGTVVLRCVGREGQRTPVTLTDVLYVPTLKGSLLSVRRITRKNFKVIFSESNCSITREGKLVATGSLRGGLYYLHLVENALAAKSAHTIECQHTWHKKFGHRDPVAVKQLIDKKLATGIKLKDCGIRCACECCIKAKMARKPFPKVSLTKTNDTLELLHTDLCGPMRTATQGGKKYILTIIDDYSRYTCVSLLKAKSDTAQAVTEYFEAVFTKFQRRPKAIRSDRGREFITEDLRQYLRKSGTQVQLTAPYSPQQNGVAERKNRYLVEMVRCLLYDADLAEKYWGEAINTANYLQNRLPTRATEKTPFELWEGRLPDMTHLHVFGCTAYVHVPKMFRGKLNPKAQKLIFVGYADGSKAYRLLDKQTGKITISRDVTFVGEEDFENTPDVETSLDQSRKESSIEQNPDEKTASIEQEQEQEQCVSRTDKTIVITSDEESFEDAGEDNDEDQHGEDEELRRSSRRNKGRPPDRFTISDRANMVSTFNMEPRTVAEALSSPDKEKWSLAMKDEIQALMTNHTWDLVDLPEGRKPVGSKWVFKIKTDTDGNICRYKARLVAQGFSQKYGKDYDEVFAPVVGQTTVRIFFTLAGKRGLIVKQFDAKTAFLNGDLKETVYMVQPEGFTKPGGEDKVCRLRKSLYGLKQAAKTWYDTLRSVLNKHEYQQSRSDKCLFKRITGTTTTYLIVYVDDFLIASTTQRIIDETEEVLRRTFDIVSLGEPRSFLGFRVRKDERGIFHLDQEAYIDKIINRNGMRDAKTSHIPMDPGSIKNRCQANTMESNKNYQERIGELLYVGVNARPDILAPVCILSQHTTDPTIVDWTETKRILKYLKGTKQFQLKLGNIEERNTGLVAYSDADWAQGRSDRKSISGFLIRLHGSTIGWGCRKQTCVALSTTEAEYVALVETCKELLWIHQILEDFDESIAEPTTVLEDNQSCLALLNNPRAMSNRTKHMDTRFQFARDLAEKGQVNFKYCPTEIMLADLLTKPLGRIRLATLREKIGLKEHIQG